MRRQVAVATVMLALVSGAFLLGRLTASNDAPITSAKTCLDLGRTGLSMPESYARPDGLAYFSRCERDAALNVGFGEPMGIVQVYAQAEGDEVIAWWYIECGYPEGLVAVGAKRTPCVSTDTTGATDG